MMSKISVTNLTGHPKHTGLTGDKGIYFVIHFVLLGCRREEDRREPKDPGGLLHDGLHQQGLPHHGQVRAGRQGAEGRALRHVVVVTRAAAAAWVGGADPDFDGIVTQDLK